MNLNSIRYMTKFTTLVLSILLLIGLASCASGESKVAGTSEISPPPSGSASSAPTETAVPSASPEASTAQPYTDEDIAKIYAEHNLSAIEIRNAGMYTIVHYSSLGASEKTSRFDWFDRETGKREFVCGFIYADKFEITAEKTLTVLTSGLPPFDGYQQFPRLLMYSYPNVDGAAGHSSIESDYYMPLAQSFTVGDTRPAALKNICYEGGSMLLTFDAQPGYEEAFHADTETVPMMNVINGDGVSTVTIYDTVLSEDFTLTSGSLLGSDPCPVTVTSDGKDTIVTFKMHADAGRYNISCFTTPIERVVHAVISYAPDNFGYPKGW